MSKQDEEDTNLGEFNMERKALERLLTAILDSEFTGNRLKLMEEAIITALLALDDSEDSPYKSIDGDDIQESLDNLAIQLIASKLQEEELSIYRISIDPTDPDNEEDPVQIVATSHPILLGMINHGVDQLTKEFDEFDVN